MIKTADALIEKFKEVKEELEKNMNGSYAPGANMKPSATTGTSGGQGGMYRSEGNASPGGAQDMSMIKYDKNGQWRMDKIDEPHKDDPHHEAKEKKIAKDIKAKAKKLESMHKTDELAETIIDKLEKHYDSVDGKNREANPKLRPSDLGPGGKVHLIKDEGVNIESEEPHNKAKFKVMPMAPEKSEKHASPTGKPYDGKDKHVKKGEECMEKDSVDPKLAPKDAKVKMLQQKIDAGTYKPDPKKIANAMVKEEKKQGNDAKGFDENKAPGRGTLSV